LKKPLLIKKIAFLLVFNLLFPLTFTGCGDNTQKFNDGEELKVNLSSDSYGISTDVTIKNDFKRYTEIDLSSEDESLKRFCFTAVLDSQNNAVASLETSQNTDEENNTCFLESLGFENVLQLNIGEGEKEDTNDTTKMVVGYKKISNKKIFISVALSGTDGDNEWESNFDIGADVPAYEGTHSDWTDKENHKGFDVTANRVVTALSNYVSDNSLSSKTATIAITGYSRGAAVANLTAQKIVDNSKLIGYKKVRVGAYTFATPRTTTNANAHGKKYNCIKNYINTEDVVTLVPPITMGFERFGEDKEFTITGNTKLETAYKKLSGSDYNTAGGDVIIGTIEAMVTDRNNLYSADGMEDNYYKIENTDKSVVEASRESFINSYKKVGLENCLKESQIVYNEQTSTYAWICYITDSVLLGVFPKVASQIGSGNITSALNYVGLLNNTRHKDSVSAILSAVISNKTYLQQTHLPISYFLGSF